MVSAYEVVLMIDIIDTIVKYGYDPKLPEAKKWEEERGIGLDTRIKFAQNLDAYFT